MISIKNKKYPDISFKYGKGFMDPSLKISCSPTIFALKYNHEEEPLILMGTSGFFDCYEINEINDLFDHMLLENFDNFKKFYSLRNDKKENATLIAIGYENTIL